MFFAINASGIQSRKPSKAKSQTPQAPVALQPRKKKSPNAGLTCKAAAKLFQQTMTNPGHPLCIITTLTSILTLILPRSCSSSSLTPQHIFSSPPVMLTALRGPKLSSGLRTPKNPSDSYRLLLPKYLSVARIQHNKEPCVAPHKPTTLQQADNVYARVLPTPPNRKPLKPTKPTPEALHRVAHPHEHQIPTPQHPTPIPQSKSTPSAPQQLRIHPEIKEIRRGLYMRGTHHECPQDPVWSLNVGPSDMGPPQGLPY